MKQTYTSRDTSVNTTRLPRAFSAAAPFPHGRLVFDYGCGKQTDHIRAAFPGIVYVPYDPFNQPAEVNSASLYYVRCAMRARLPVTVISSNVLNVIDSDDAVLDIARTIRQIVTGTGGVGYVTVYEGDRSGVGRQTGPDQYQRNQPLAAYLPLFPGARIRRGMIEVRPEKEGTQA